MTNGSTWFCTHLDREEVAAGEVSRRQEAFMEAFAAAGGPRQMALFRRTREDGGIDLFLTPDCDRFATPLLRQWGSLPCDRPSLVALELLVGHNEITYYMP